MHLLTENANKKKLDCLEFAHRASLYEKPLLLLLEELLSLSAVREMMTEGFGLSFELGH